MMNNTKKSQNASRKKPRQLPMVPISSFRGAGKQRYTSDMLLRGRNEERREEQMQQNHGPIHI
jgi:hypothetical protein